MKSKNFQCLKEIDGEEYVFATNVFRMKLQEKIKKEKGRKIRVNEIQTQMAEYIGVSVEAIKNWKYGYNGPSEYSIVEAIACCLEIDDVQMLLEKRKEFEMEIQSAEKSKRENHRRLYGSVVEFLFDMDPLTWYGYAPVGETETYYYDRLDVIDEQIDSLDATQEQINQLKQLLVCDLGEFLEMCYPQNWESNNVLIDMYEASINEDAEESSYAFVKEVTNFVIEEIKRILGK